MNRSRASLPIYICSLALFAVLVAAAFLIKDRRVGLLTAAFATLALAFLAERVFWPATKTSGPARKDVLGLASLPVSGSLYLGDIFESGRPPIVVEASIGVYDVTVERVAKGDDHYVAAVILTSAEPHGPGVARVRVDTETGFIAIVNRSPDKALRATLVAARDRILHEKGRRVDAELVRVETEVVGVVCASGFGDGQYEIVRGERGWDIRFIENLKEMV